MPMASLVLSKSSYSVNMLVWLLVLMITQITIVWKRNLNWGILLIALVDWQDHPKCVWHLLVTALVRKWHSRRSTIAFCLLGLRFCQEADLLYWWFLLTSEPAFPGLHYWLWTSSSQESSRFWVPDWDRWGIQHGLSNCWIFSLGSVKHPPQDAPSFEDSESTRFLASQVQDHCHYYFTISWFNKFLHA